MAKEIIETPKPVEQAEFVVTLDEFLSEIPQAKVETKAGFGRLCQTENIRGLKQRSDWAKLFTLFETQPVNIKWSDWISKGGR